MGMFQEAIADRTEREMGDLIIAATSTDKKRVIWRPLDKGRHVLDILQECGMVNARYAEIIAARESVVWPVERFIQRKEHLDTMEKAAESLRAETLTLCERIRAMPDEALFETIRFATSRDKTLADCAIFPLTHMCYHEGQINYVQTLYDDWTHYY